MTPEEAKLVDKFMGEDYSCSFIEYTDYSNWNNIIQVCQKIESQGCIVEIGFNLDIFCRICVIGKKHEKAFNIFTQGEGITPVFEAILEYVEYYNSKQ